MRSGFPFHRFRSTVRRTVRPLGQCLSSNRIDPCEAVGRRPPIPMGLALSIAGRCCDTEPSDWKIDVFSVLSRALWKHGRVHDISRVGRHCPFSWRRRRWRLRVIVTPRSVCSCWALLACSWEGASVPKGPRGEKRPADAVSRAIMVAKIAELAPGSTSERPLQETCLNGTDLPRSPAVLYWHCIYLHPLERSWARLPQPTRAQ